MSRVERRASESGLTLVEVAVAGAIMGILAWLVAQKITEMSRADAAANARASVFEDMREISGLISRDVSMRLAGAGLPLAPTSLTVTRRTKANYAVTRTRVWNTVCAPLPAGLVLPAPARTELANGSSLAPGPCFSCGAGSRPTIRYVDHESGRTRTWPHDAEGGSLSRALGAAVCFANTGGNVTYDLIFATKNAENQIQWHRRKAVQATSDATGIEILPSSRK